VTAIIRGRAGPASPRRRGSSAAHLRRTVWAIMGKGRASVTTTLCKQLLPGLCAAARSLPVRGRAGPASLRRRGSSAALLLRTAWAIMGRGRASVTTALCKQLLLGLGAAARSLPVTWTLFARCLGRELHALGGLLLSTGFASFGQDSWGKAAEAPAKGGWGTEGHSHEVSHGRGLWMHRFRGRGSAVVLDFRDLFVQLHAGLQGRELWMHCFLGKGTGSMLRNRVDVRSYLPGLCGPWGFRGWLVVQLMSSWTRWVWCFASHCVDVSLVLALMEWGLGLFAMVDARSRFCDG